MARESEIDECYSRVVIVGSSCAGKTSYAQRLAGLLGHPRVELDALHWLPDWVERSTEEFRELVSRSVSRNHWIVDGNYRIARDLLWPRATCVIWLNYSFPRVFFRGLRRTLRRSLTGEELYSGNRESLRKAFLDRDSILLWVITSFRRRRTEFAALKRNCTYSHLHWEEFKHPAEAEEFLRSLQSRAVPASVR